MCKKKFFIQLSYDGTAYHGWQIQPNASTVQETIEQALRVLSGEKVSTMGCGRTDTGVHAADFYLHCELNLNQYNKDEFNYKLNHLLPDDISVKRIFEVDAALHARFSAVKREYRYYLYQQKNPFLKHYCAYFSKQLDVQSMREAGKLLFKHKDFTSFSKSKTDTKTNDCTMLNFEINELPDGRLEFVIEANRFLRNMVRSIVGTLLDVGTGKLDLTRFEQIIVAKNRSKAGVSVPANGLFLSRVSYEKGAFEGQNNE